jgi:hypothetical protein
VSELNLPMCPICCAEDVLSRQTMERAGKPFTWYECAECGSVLLWLGDDEWAYQKVGREEKEHLLRQPLTLDELQALLPRPESDALPVAAAGVAEQKAEESLQTTRKRDPRYLILSLLVLCVIGICVAVGIVAYRLVDRIPLP